MTMSKFAAAAVSVAGLAGVLGSGAASAATSVTAPHAAVAPVGWHLTALMPSQSAAQSAVNAYLPKIKAAGDTVTDSDVELVPGGWQGEVFYSGSKVMSGDKSATIAKDLPQLVGYHNVGGFKTLADAQNHFAWAKSELAKHTDDKQLRSGSVGLVSAPGATPVYAYNLSYFTSKSTLFAGDPVKMYVENDNNTGMGD